MGAEELVTLQHLVGAKYLCGLNFDGHSRIALYMYNRYIPTNNVMLGYVLTSGSHLSIHPHCIVLYI